MIFSSNGLEQRLFADPRGVYGISREVSQNSILLEFQSTAPKYTVIDIQFLEMLFLEKYLLYENGLVLHSSFIEYEKKGILFTAPSGTGKSTQAELWHKYKNAAIINGDRTILIKNKETNSFDACGLPFCGSSQINEKQQFPLRAIVFLSQAKENCATYLSASQAATRLFGEMSINKWNHEAVEKSLNLIDQLILSIPMIDYHCNMEPDAVFELAKFL